MLDGEVPLGNDGAVVRTIILMVDMALGKSRGDVAQDQVDGRLASWSRQGPASCLTPSELVV